MINKFKKITQSVKTRGVVASAYLAASRLALPVATKLSDYLYVESQEWAFDHEHKVNTRGTISPAKYSPESRGKAHNNGYHGSPAVEFKKLMDSSGLKFEDYTFIDVGCGKGKPLFLAAEYPFKKIVGVEYSETLVDIATKNVENFRSPTQKCFNFAVVCADATQYKLPKGNLLLYFFNPFGEPLMKKFVEHVRESQESDPRKIVIYYYNPKHPEVWEKSGLFSKIFYKQHYCAIFQNQI